MLRLHSKTDRPDFNYLNMTLQNSMNIGIRVNLSDEFNRDLKNELDSARIELLDYGLDEPNKTQKVLDTLRTLAKNDPYIEECCYVNDKWTSNKSALKKLVYHENEFASSLMWYRRLKKYISSIESLQVLADGNGFVHPTICGSATNRVQYRDPGLLTIPKVLIWDVLLPRDDNWEIFSADIKNQEPWILINMLDIKELKDLLGISQYGSLYDMLFITFYKKVPTEIERKEFKQVWNALTYGASKQGISDLCHNIDSSIVYTYFNKLSGYKEYKKRMNAIGYSGGRVVETVFGTKLRVDGSTNSKAVRQLMNFGIQGTGADILAFLVKHFEEEVANRGLEDKVRLYFTRHDELVIEVHKDFIKELGGNEAVYALIFDMLEHRIDTWEPFKMTISKVEGSLGKLFETDTFLDDEDDTV